MHLNIYKTLLEKGQNQLADTLKLDWIVFFILLICITF